jgi:mRNA interferase MazF
MREGSVVLADLPQADGKVKRRPAIVLRAMPGHGDLPICGVSTRLHECVQGFDGVVSVGGADFGSSGLAAESLVRLGFLAAVPPRRVMGSIGEISPERHGRLLRALADYPNPGR